MDEKRLKKLLHSITNHANKIREAQKILEEEVEILCCCGVSDFYTDSENKVSMQITKGINDIMEVLKITEYENKGDRGDIRIATYDGLKIIQVANKETGEFD